MNSNQIIQSLWIGSALSNLEILCINSYLRNGHDFHLYTYEAVKNVPPGTTIMDANEIVMKDYIFCDLRGTYASFADYFRYKILYCKGGWWVDMDTVCLKYFDFPEDYCFSSENQVNRNVVVNIGYLKIPQEAEVLKDCINYIESNLGVGDGNNVPWGKFGLSLWDTVLRNYDASPFIKQPSVFCPVNFFELSQLITKGAYVPGSETYAVHFWNEIWRHGYLDKNGIYHPESIFEILKRKYSY